MNDHNPDDEFYIGYLPTAPRKTAKMLRVVALGLFLFLILSAVVIALFQKPFSNGKFEYGTLTRVSGVYHSEPVPHLFKSGEKSITILVGFGKAGAKETLGSIEKLVGQPLEGAQVTLIGTKIYNEGKDLLQVTAEDNRSIAYSAASSLPTPTFEPLGVASLSGEVVDPKCYFGVMKPGEGKPHRSCAIRCISGGIPPVLLIRGNKNEHVIIDALNINHKILPIVGEPVVLTGLLYQYGEWKILKADVSSIESHVKLKIQEELLTQDKKFTLCNSTF